MDKLTSELLSVVVPVYKVEPYLDQCVESIVNQTYSNLEIILVDDGSPDNCPKMCDDWAERDSRIRVIHKENGGLSDARNAGVAVATGEFLAFVDSDDYLEPEMYELMLSALRRTGVQMACCGISTVEKGNKTPQYCDNKQRVFSSEEALREVILCGSIRVTAYDKVFRRDYFHGREFPQGEIYEDLAIIPRIIGEAGAVVRVGVPLYNYRADNPSITRSGYSPSKRILVQRFQDLENYLKEAYENLLPCLDVLRSDVCHGILYQLLDNPEVKRQHREDYLLFYEQFRKSFPGRVRQKKMSRDQLLKGILVYFGIYYYLHELKRRVWKLSGNSWS